MHLQKEQKDVIANTDTTCIANLAKIQVCTGRPIRIPRPTVALGSTYVLHVVIAQLLRCVITFFLVITNIGEAVFTPVC